MEQKDDNAGKKYWAFISYSHDDDKWGKWLAHRLETFQVPKDLVDTNGDHGELPKRLFPVFRDREELGPAADLGEEIQEALQESRSLIVICSTSSASSEWVDREIRSFRALGRGDSIFAFIVDGEPGVSPHVESAPDECFPPSLRFASDSQGDLTTTVIEPLAADARDQGDGRDIAALKLIASVLGVNYEQLKRRDHERRIRRLRKIVAGLAALVVVFVALSLYANQQRLTADAQRNSAIGRQLGATAQFLERDDSARLADAALLAVRSMQYERSLAADTILRKAIRLTPRPLQAFEHPGLVDPLGMSVEGRYWAGAFMDTVARVWDLSIPDIIAEIPTDARTERVAVSMDGALLATGDEAGLVRLWSIPGGELVASYECDGGQVTSLTFSRWNKRFAFACEGDPPRVASIEDWSITTTMEDPDGRRSTVALKFHPAGDRLAAVTSNDAIQVWDTTSGEEMKYFAGMSGAEMCCNGIVAYDGSYLAAKLMSGLRSNNALTVWKTNSWDAAVQVVHDSPIQALAINAMGNLVASGDQEGVVRIWSLRNGREVGRVRHDAGITSLEIDRAGKWLASASSDQTARVWDLDTLMEISRVGESAPVWRSGFVSGSKQFAALTRYNRLSTWTLPSTELDLRRTDAHAFDHCVDATGNFVIMALPGATYRISVADGSSVRKAYQPQSSRDATISPDCSTVAYVGPNRSGGTVLRVLDIESGDEILNEPVSISVSSTNRRGRIAFSPDGKLLALGGDSGRALVFDMSSEQVIFESAERRSWSAFVGFADNGRSLILNTDRKTQILGIATDWQSTAEFESTRVFDMRSSPTGRYVAVAHMKGVSLIDAVRLESRELELPIEDERSSKSVDKIGFSNDGRRLAFAGRTKLRTYNIDTAEYINDIRLNARLTALNFGANDETLIAVEKQRLEAGTQYVTRVWDIDSSRELSRLTSERETSSVAMSKGNEWLLNGGVHAFSVTTLIQNACDRIDRAFTPDEWADIVYDIEYAPVCP